MAIQYGRGYLWTTGIPLQNYLPWQLCSASIGIRRIVVVVAVVVLKEKTSI